jgi:hypothetical protein
LEPHRILQPEHIGFITHLMLAHRPETGEYPPRGACPDDDDSSSDDDGVVAADELLGHEVKHQLVVQDGV